MEPHQVNNLIRQTLARCSTDRGLDRLLGTGVLNLPSVLYCLAALAKQAGLNARTTSLLTDHSATGSGMTKLFSFIELDDGLLHMDEMRTALPGATRLLFMAFSSCEQAEQTLAAPGSSIRWTPNDTPSYEVDETTIERVAPLGWLRASLMADTLEHATAQPATRPARPRTL